MPNWILEQIAGKLAWCKRHKGLVPYSWVIPHYGFCTCVYHLTPNERAGVPEAVR